MIFSETVQDFFKEFIPQYFWANDIKSSQLNFWGH